MTSPVSPETLYKIGHLLSTSNELIQMILQNLNYYELIEATKVSQSWSNIAFNIIQRRRKFCYLTLHSSELPTTETKGSIVGTNSENSTLSLKDFLKSVPTQPYVCFCFANGDGFDNLSHLDPNIPDGSLFAYLKQHLSSSCQLCLVKADGVIGSVEQKYLKNQSASNHNLNCALGNVLPNETRFNCDNSPIISNQSKDKSNNYAGYSIEIEGEVLNKETSALSLIMIPLQPKVKINVIHLDHQKFASKSLHQYHITESEFNSLCKLSPEEELKALLVFDTYSDKFTRVFVDAAVSRQNQKLALGGGYIDQLEPNGERCAITISGENVLTASIILSSVVKKSNEIESTLLRLKDCGFPEEHSFAFLFSCCGRGRHWYKRSIKGNEDGYNIETKIFRKLFPKTPIFGFFGNGEIGLNHLPKYGTVNFEDSIPTKKSKKRTFHSYTSVIVFISIL